MREKHPKNGWSNSTKKSVGQFDIRDIIRRAQDDKREQKEIEAKVEEPLNGENHDIGKNIKDEESESIKDLLNDSPICELSDEESTLDHVPSPKRKTEYERYLKSKERAEQVRKYNEKIIKESRQERAQMRAKVRQREAIDEDEITSNESSPTKKVRFKIMK